MILLFYIPTQVSTAHTFMRMVSFFPFVLLFRSTRSVVVIIIIYSLLLLYCRRLFSACAGAQTTTLFRAHAYTYIIL